MGCSGCCGNETQEENGVEDFHGPVEQRQCRDVIFLLIFIAFLGGVGFFSYMALRNGNPYRLFNGYDSYGNTCDMQHNAEIPNVPLSGRDTRGKSKVFFFDPMYFLSKLAQNPLTNLTDIDTEIICVEKCPDRVVGVLDFYNDDGVNLCRYDIIPYVSDISKCPATPVTPHKNILNRCVPASVIEAAKAAATTFASMGDNIPQKILSDLRSTWREIVYMCAGSVGVSFIVVLLMRFLAAIIVWTIILAIIVLSLGATTYCWYTWNTMKQQLDTTAVDLQTEAAKSDVQMWFLYAIIASAITVVLLLILLVMRKRIALVVTLFSEAGNAIGRMPCLLVQPFWTLIFLIVSIAGLAVVAVFIETSGTPVVNPSSGHVKYELSDFWVYVRWYNIFAMLWIGSFIVACQDLVVAGAVATWYFSRDKSKLGCPVLKSIMRLIRYHIGSVAFGSFIIALVMLARVILAFIQKKLKNRAGKVVDFILKCLQCCLWCFERCLRYLNRNAYIEIAIYGYSFCHSAKTAFLLIVANALRVATINSLGDFILFLGKLGTVAIVAVLGHEYIKNREDLNFIWVPITVACVFAFLVSHSFLLVYEITIDTIFLCFCEDCERNDGASNPYFMSTNLMTYLDRTEKAGTSNQPVQKQAVQV